MRELAEKTPYITIADWNQVAKEHPEIWAGTDQVHFGSDTSKIEAGAKLYAEYHCCSLANSSRQAGQIKITVLKEKSWRNPKLI